jgi:hypothetical protein
VGGSGVGAYVAQVDRVLAAGQGLFPQGGPTTSALNAGGPGVPAAPVGVSGMSVGTGGAARDYRGSWAQVAGLDDDASAAAGAGDATGQDGRAGATRVRQTAQSAAAAIAPATGSPAGVKVLVSNMDDRMADMQRQIDATKAQNKLLAARMRQMVMAYRALGAGGPGATGGVVGGGGGTPVVQTVSNRTGGAAPLTMRPESQGHSGDDDEPYVVDDPEVLSALTAPFNGLILDGGWTWADKGLGGR